MEQTELQHLVENISIKKFNRPFRHRAMFNHRLKTTGGRYLLTTHHIELNRKYYEEQGLEALIGIIKHELCHYHLHLEGKGYQHRDQDFKRLLQAVGGPRFCSPLKNEMTSYKYVYSCESCGQFYNRKRKMNTEKYVCGKCKGKLKLQQKNS